jgi:hypothetical protein
MDESLNATSNQPELNETLQAKQIKKIPLKNLLNQLPPSSPPPQTLNPIRKESIKVSLLNETQTNTQLLTPTNVPTATTTTTKNNNKPAMSILDVIAKAKATKAAEATGVGVVPSSPATTTTTTPRSPRDFENPNERLKSKLAKKNWQTVINVAVVKESSGIGYGGQMNRFDNIYATNTENWTFVSIIIAVVTVLSILICFLVYIFFHKFRT